MIRPVLTEFGFFLIPFAVYAAVSDRDAFGLLVQTSWPLHMVGKLVAGLAAARHRQLRAVRANFPARRRVRPMFPPISRTASSCPASRNEGRMTRRACSLMRRWLTSRPGRRACWRCSTATARRRASSAAPCATRCSDSRRRHRHRHHGAARRSHPPRHGRPHQERADRHRARHGDAGGRGPARSRSRRCARISRPSAARPRSRSAATGCATPSGATSPSTRCRSTPHGTVHDHVGGLDDIAARRVRFIGDPARAHRRGLSAHPALLPHPCRLWRGRARSRRAISPASAAAPGLRRCRPSACARRC